MEKISLIDTDMRIDTRRQNFDINNIPNRRFMYNPKTGTLLLGKRDPGGNKVESSHAEEHGRTIGSKEPYDDFVRGWIGANKEYPYAVIHFAPPISKENIALFDKGFSTLEMFAKNGAVQKTLIRGFPGKWEQPLSSLLRTPTLMERLEQKKQMAEAQPPPAKTRKINQERG